MVSRVVNEMRAINLSICIALIRAGGIGMDRLKTISLISDYEAAIAWRGNAGASGYDDCA
jgi:hypothetical protein